MQYIYVRLTFYLFSSRADPEKTHLSIFLEILWENSSSERHHQVTIQFLYKQTIVQITEVQQMLMLKNYLHTHSKINK